MQSQKLAIVKKIQIIEQSIKSMDKQFEMRQRNILKKANQYENHATQLQY